MRWSARHGFGLLLALGALLGGWALFVGPRRLVVNRVELDVPNWPAAQAGVRIALLSDLHVGSPHWGIERLRQLVSQTNAERPDLVLLAGDYLINDVSLGSWVAPEPIAEALGELRAPLGVVAVLGNHDWWNDGPRMRAALEKAGIAVLENDAHPVNYRGGRFFVVGLADTMTREVRLEAALAQVPEGEPLLVLVHEPDVFTEVNARPSLTLAGHTHGGQVALPLLGRPIVPSRFGQRYASGHVVENGRHLFVTSGVGTSILPVRFGVPPEIALLTLR